jgi:5-bromo-4-chloroindolyl phosphate hydrolysis protein
MREFLRQGRAWAPVLKAAALFVMPLPLLVAAIVALFVGEGAQIAQVCGGLAALWSAGVLVWQALTAEARYLLGQRPDPPRVPLKALSAALTGTGVALAAAAGGHGLVGTGFLAAFAVLGHLGFYGRDLRPRRVTLAAAEGVDVAALTIQLKEAHGRLLGIETAARRIAVPEFGARLARITAIGRRILAEIEQDPRDAARARRFLNVYLDSTERIVRDFARTHGALRQRPLEDSFRQLLEDLEQTFEAQHRKLLENDAVALDVEIEVLNTRLKREGIQ